MLIKIVIYLSGVNSVCVMNSGLSTHSQRGIGDRTANAVTKVLWLKLAVHVNTLDAVCEIKNGYVILKTNYISLSKLNKAKVVLCYFVFIAPLKFTCSVT